MSRAARTGKRIQPHMSGLVQYCASVIPFSQPEEGESYQAQGVILQRVA